MVCGLVTMEMRCGGLVILPMTSTAAGDMRNDCEGDAVFQIEELYEGLFAEGI